MRQTLPAAIQRPTTSERLERLAKLIGCIDYWARKSDATPSTRIHHIRRILGDAEAAK